MQMAYEQGGRENLTVNYTGTQLKTFSGVILFFSKRIIPVLSFDSCNRLNRNYKYTIHISYTSKHRGRRHWTKIYTGTQIFIITLAWKLQLNCDWLVSNQVCSNFSRNLFIQYTSIYCPFSYPCKLKIICTMFYVLMS